MKAQTGIKYMANLVFGASKVTQGQSEQCR